MKRSLTLGLICISYALAALPAPKPIEGHPSIISKTFSSCSGDFTFKFTPPKDWGFGSISSSQGSGYYELFPVNGGAGCTIEIKKYDDENLLKVAVEDLKKGFKSVKPLDNGFEAELPKAWFACRVQGNHLIQIWYSLPKKAAHATAAWNDLKNCLAISQKAAVDKNQPYARVTEAEYDGYWCHHPNNKLHVLFKSFPIIRCTINKDDKLVHYIRFSDLKAVGYFFIKWDQINLGEKAPYQGHLNEMLKEITQIEPKQKMEKEAVFNVASGYSLWRGSPYNLLTVSADGFLFGFAIKPEGFLNVDLNDYIGRVKWKIDNN